MSKLIEAARLPINQIQTAKQLLMSEAAMQQLSMVATAHLNPTRMMRVLANAMRTNPTLADCHPMSLLGCLMQCSALGLEPNTILGHAYIIPFKNRKKNIVEAQLVVGYKGLIDLARRSGHIISIHAGIHYSDDELWIYEEGTQAQLRHIAGPEEGKKLHVYAIATFRDGGHAWIVLPWSRVMKIRDGSQGYQSAISFGRKDNPWMTHEDAMAKKTAIRALAKYLPLSVEFVDAVGIDGKHVDFAAFALDPNGVPDIEEDPAIEGEAVDHSAPPAKTEAPPKRAARAAASKPPKEEPKPEPEKNPADDAKPEPDPEAKPRDATEHPMYGEVLGYIADGIGAGLIREGFEEKFAALAKEDPAAWAEIDRLLNESAAESNIDTSHPEERGAEDDADFDEV